MTITSGTRLGPYEIVASIGVGGMGEVYEARDTRLDRAVAIKILPSEFAGNARLKARFEREAKTISRLSHPNICTLFDVGENYIVMELLEGESLASRLAHGSLPLSEVLKYGMQIGEALGKAHREGVVHRDLKPGNIMITRSGVKLLDFGLAKTAMITGSPSGATVEKPLTQEGIVVGTLQYMAPEQLAGEEPDARTDIFALGCVLYEMTTGKRAFEGSSKTSLIAAIVTADPKPMSTLQPLAPPALDHVVKKCLAKGRDDRWQNARDIAEELRWISETGPQAGLTGARRMLGVTRERIAWLVAVIAVVLAFVTGWRGAEKQGVPVMRLAIPLPQQTTFDSFGLPALAISPDGTRIVYAAIAGVTPRLWIRYIDRLDSIPLSGTDGAFCPFFSPDGQWVAFVADGVLKRVAISGGGPVAICAVGSFRGGTWGRDGNIYYAPHAGSGIWKVPVAGKTPVMVTRPDPSRDENSERWPQILPDGKHVIVTTKTPQITSFDSGRIAVVSLETGAVVTLIEGGTYGRYAPNGRLLFARGDVIYSVAFDPKTMRVNGTPMPVVDGVYVHSATGGAYFAFSDNGSFVYVPRGAPVNNALTWIDREGRSSVVSTGERELYSPRVSPDGRTVAAQIRAANDDIGLFDIARGAITRLTFDPGNENSPVWTPDGTRVIYSAETPGGEGFRLMEKKADGSGTSQELLRSPNLVRPFSVSADGTGLAYVESNRTTGADIWLLSLVDRNRTAFLQTPFNEFSPMFSPDGKWLAYQSNESGRDEIYVRSLAPGSGRVQISTDGGVTPRWSHDGRVIFFWNANHFYGAAITGGRAFSVGKPRELAATHERSATGINLLSQYDVAPDGRFVVTETETSLPVSHLNFVGNWSDDVRRTGGT